MKKITVLVMLFILIFVSCSMPSGNNDPVVTKTHATVQDQNALQGLLFPKWWVNSGYENTGGSPEVVVFNADGHLYTRSQANNPLESSGTWTYDSKTK